MTGLGRDRAHHPCDRLTPCCGVERVRIRRWDAYACTGCWAWLEDPCDCPPKAHCPYSEHTLGPRPERAR